MLGEVSIQFENERFNRLYSEVSFSIIEAEGQALIYTGSRDFPEEILVLERISVSLFSGDDCIQVSGFAPNGKGAFDRCSLEFRPYCVQPPANKIEPEAEQEPAKRAEQELQEGEKQEEKE